MSSTSTAKAKLRSTLRAARSERTEADRADAAEAIAQHGVDLLRGLSRDMPLLVATYLSMPTEPGTDALIALA